MVKGLAIEVGDKIPEFDFLHADAPTGKACSRPSVAKSADIFGGKTVVLIGVPAAFSPTCSDQHIPGFIKKLAELKGRGVDTIAVVSVNDAYTMAHWAASLGAPAEILMLADGNGEFTRMIGMEQDMRAYGMGLRGKRYALIVRKEIVKFIGIDEGALDKSSVENILNQL